MRSAAAGTNVLSCADVALAVERVLADRADLDVALLRS